MSKDKPPPDPFAEGGVLLGEPALVNVREAKLKQSAAIESLEKRLRDLERATANMYVHLCRSNLDANGNSAPIPVDQALLKALKEDRPIKVTTKFAASGALIITFEPVEA
jgi:hypothetical protein